MCYIWHFFLMRAIYSSTVNITPDEKAVLPTERKYLLTIQIIFLTRSSSTICLLCINCLARLRGNLEVFKLLLEIIV